MKHSAPTIVIDLHRYNQPEKFGFHTLVPTSDAWRVYPLGTAQPRYQRNSVLLNEETSAEKRDELISDGYQRLAWSEIPAYLQEFLIDQEVPLEFKHGLRRNEEELTSRVSVWVKGTLPTQRLDKEESNA